MAPFRNKLLTLAGIPERDALLPHLEPCELIRGQKLDEPNRPLEFAYFPEAGIASIIAVGPSGRRVEIGPFGREGMSGTSVLLGSRISPHESIVQISGKSHRIAVEALEHAIESNRSLHRLLLKYVQAFVAQTSETLLVNSYAGIEQRLARWLLMAHDRSDGQDVAITHEYISEMLAVRRPGVTEAVQVIEGRGLIRATRGHVTVLDRKGLEQLAGPAYGFSEAEYRRLLGLK